MPRPSGYKIYLSKEDLDLCIYLLDNNYSKALICKHVPCSRYILDQTLKKNNLVYKGLKGKISKEQKELLEISILKDIDEYKKNNNYNCSICYDRSEYYKSPEFNTTQIY